MSFTIYYPITITLIIIILYAVLIYSIIKLNSIGFPNITNDSCDIIPKYLICVLITTGIFVFSLLPNCGLCSELSSKVFRFITPLMYYFSYIAIITQINLNIDCLSNYKNSTNENIKLFLTVLIWNFSSFTIIIHLILISFIISQCCIYCSKKKNQQLPIIVNESKPLIILE